MRGGGRSLNGIRYPSRRTDTTQGSAPMADHCRQWCARHPPTHPEWARASVGEFFGPFALATGVAGKASGLGKGSPIVAVLVLPVSSLRVRLAVGVRHLLLTGGQWRTSRHVSRSVGGVGPAVALCWSLRNGGGGGGACGRGHHWKLHGPC